MSVREPGSAELENRPGQRPPAPPAPPTGPPLQPRRRPRQPARPGVALAWAGLVLGLAGLGVMNVRVGGKGIWWLVLGVFGLFVDMALIVGGISLAGLGLVLSIWGLIVTIRWKSGVHALCAIGLAISLGAVILGNFLYADYLPKYERGQEALRVMEEQPPEPPGTASAPATQPAPSGG